MQNNIADERKEHTGKKGFNRANRKISKKRRTFSSFIACYNHVDLYQLQTKLYDVGTRRRYFTAYIEGYFSPAVLFNATRLSADIFDHPNTQSKLLQYNAILASATRAFGAPPHVYREFENRARSLTKELLTDFTNDTALGFHMLSMHYWGSNTDLGEHYRDLTLSTCNRALARPQNKIDAAKLVALNLVTLGIQDSDRGQPNILQHNRTQLEKALQHSGLSIESLGVDDFINFSHFHVLLSNNLLGVKEDSSYCFTELEEKCFARFCESFDEVNEKIRNERNATSPALLLASAMNEFLMGLAIYLKDPDSNLTHFENGVRIFNENEYLIAVSGPRFMAVLDAAFKACYFAKNYYLAEKIVEIQKKEFKFYPEARKGAEENAEMLTTICVEEVVDDEPKYQSDLFNTKLLDGDTSFFIPAPVSPFHSDPFHSSIQIGNFPVLHH